MESRERERKRKEIVELLANIKDHFKRLEDYSNIPTLELNVILSKISKLQEKTSILKFLMSKQEKDYQDENVRAHDSSANQEINVPETDLSSAKVDKEKKEGFESSQEKMQNEGAASPKDNQQSNIVNNKNEVDPAISSTGKGIGKIEDYVDLNARFTNEDQSLSEQLKKQPISNLLTAIGLNERYLFANQLFNGDMAKFIDEIKKLNAFESEEEALDYFDNKLSNKDSWKSSEDLVQAFRLLIKRRFQD